MNNVLENYSKDEFNLLVTDAALESLQISDKTNRNLVSLWFQVDDKKDQQYNNMAKLERFCQFAHGIFEIDTNTLKENIIKKIGNNRRDLETIRRLKEYIEKMTLAK